MSKFMEANEKIAQKVVEGYKKIEDGVVSGYKKIETGAVEGFGKVADKCAEVLFAKEGESLEEAKARLSGKENTGVGEYESTFSYTYSAQENQQVLNIRKKYLPREESKLEQLKRLDHKVQSAGMVEALTIGIGNSLVFGVAMCFGLGVFGSIIWPCVPLGLMGAAGMGFAYPVYKKIFEKKKQEYTPRILELTAELTGEL